MKPEMPAPSALEVPLVLAPEDHPCLDDIEVDDGKPLDSFYQEKLHRILTESLFSSWPGPGEGRPFLVLSNVGLFYAVKEPALVPDIMLRLDVAQNRDLSLKENQAYFTWIVGKPPNVVIEFVSDKRGREATSKLTKYADIAITYYAVFDPKHRLSPDTLRIHRLVAGAYQLIQGNQLDGIELGLVLWQGKYEGQEATWLRWCDTKGVVIPTGKEQADEARRRANEARGHADEGQKRVDEGQQHSEKLAQRADKLEGRGERLAAKLRELGIDPDAITDV